MENKNKRKEKSLLFKMSETVCPICKKTFFPTPLWAWKVGDRKYCRYNCMRVEERKKYEKKKRKIAAELG